MAALESGGGLEWVQEVSELGGAASGRNVVVLSGTAASAQSTELVDVGSLGNLSSALAGLGLGVVGAGSATFNVWSVFASDLDDSVSGSWLWAAEIIDWIVGGRSTASAIYIVGNQWVDSSVAALALGGIVSSESATFRSSVWNVGDLVLSGCDSNVVLATGTVLSVALQGLGLYRAAGLGFWVERSGSAALKVSVGVGQHGSTAANGISVIVSSGSTT